MSAVSVDRLTAIINLALDDLAEGHSDLPTILQLVATIAWHEGHREALRSHPQGKPSSRPAVEAQVAGGAEPAG